MAGVLDSVMNAAQLFALKQRFDAMRSATAEEENTKRFLAERVGLGTPGQPIDVAGLPAASVLASMYDEQQMRDRAGAIAEARRMQAQSVADRLSRGGLVKFVEPKTVGEWLSMGVDIPPDQLPVDMQSPDPATLQSMYGGALGPEQAQAFGQIPWSLAKSMLGNAPINTKPPAYSVEQLDAIPGFGTMSPELQAAARASVAATGKAPTQEFWVGALAPKESGVDRYSEKDIAAAEAGGVLSKRDAEILRMAGGRAAVGNEMFRDAGVRKSFDTAKEKLLKFRLDNADADLRDADAQEKSLRALVIPGETPPPGYAAARGRTQTAWQAREAARTALDDFYSKRKSGDEAATQMQDVTGADDPEATRTKMLDLAKSMRDQGLGEDSIREHLKTWLKRNKK